jgi:hypothetical protein
LLTITYEDVILQIGENPSNISDKINFTIKNGDRIAVSCDSKVIARMIFYPLNPKILSEPRMTGKVLLNGSVPIS